MTSSPNDGDPTPIAPNRTRRGKRVHYRLYYEYTSGRFGRRTRYSGGGSMDSKVFTWLVVAFLISAVAYKPAVVAGILTSIGHGFVNLWQGFQDLFKRLVA